MIVGALKHRTEHSARKLPFVAILGVNVDVFGTDDEVHLFVLFKALVLAIHLFAQEFDDVVRDDLAAQDVAFADKISDESVAGLVVDVFGRADLLDHAVVHDHDDVAHRQRFLLVVRNEDKGDAEVIVHLFEFDLHLLAHLEVQRAERLVKEQHLGLTHDGAGDRHALLLSARKGVDVAMAVIGKSHELEGAIDLFGDLALGVLALAILGGGVGNAL